MRERLETLEERFWSKVWRCTHRHPCKKCCWPYGKPEDYIDPWVCARRRHLHARFYDQERRTYIPAHRFAYIITHGGTLIFPGKAFALCHTCDYAHCCNDIHLSLGAYADNVRDKCGKDWEYRQLQYNLFPDGRKIRYMRPNIRVFIP